MLQAQFTNSLQKETGRSLLYLCVLQETAQGVPCLRRHLCIAVNLCLGRTDGCLSNPVVPAHAATETSVACRFAVLGCNRPHGCCEVREHVIYSTCSQGLRFLKSWLRHRICERLCRDMPQNAQAQEGGAEVARCGWRGNQCHASKVRPLPMCLL